MKQLTFKASNLKADTPKSIKTIYRLVMLLSSIWGFASIGGLFPQISEHTMVQINAWVTIGNFAFYQFCQMFGYSSEETTPQ